MKRFLPLFAVLLIQLPNLFAATKPIQDITQTPAAQWNDHLLLLRDQQLGVNATTWLITASNLLNSLATFSKWLPTTNTLYLSVDGDDATAERGNLGRPWNTLSNAVYALRSGDTLVIFPGTYSHPVMPDGTPSCLIELKTNVSIIGVGMPRLYAYNESRGDMFTVRGCTNLLFEGLELYGNEIKPGSPGATLSIGIMLDTPPNHHITIRNCRFMHWARFGVCNYDFNAGLDHDITIEGCYFYRCGSDNLTGDSPTFDGAGHAIECVNGTSRNNVFDHCFRGVEIYNHQFHTISNITVQANRFIGCKGASILSINACTSATNVIHVRILDNLIVGDPANVNEADHRAIQIQRNAYVDISRNFIAHMTNWSLGSGNIVVQSDLNGGRMYNISDNFFHNIRGQPMIEVFSSSTSFDPLSEVTICRNQFSEIGRTGIGICANNVIIADNTFRDTSFGAGDHPAIWVRGSWNRSAGTNITIRGNLIADRPGALSTIPGIQVDSGYVNVVAYDNQFGPGINPLVNNAGTNLLWGIGPSNNVMTLPAAAYDPTNTFWQAYCRNSNVAIRIPALATRGVVHFAVGDETTAISAGTGKLTFRMPYAMTLQGVRASLSTAQTSGNIFTVDIHEGGTSILSTKLTIDNTEKSSTTAATAALISDNALADDAEMTVDVDQIGDGTAKGLKIWLIGTR